MTKQRSSVFSGKNRGVTPSVAAPGDTHPSDATVCNGMIMHVTTNAKCGILAPERAPVPLPSGYAYV